MLRNKTVHCRAITAKIFPQAESFKYGKKEALIVPWYSKKAKEQKNLEKFL